MTLPRVLAMPLPPSHPERLAAFHEALNAVCAEWGYRYHIAVEDVGAVHAVPAGRYPDSDFAGLYGELTYSGVAEEYMLKEISK